MKNPLSLLGKSIMVTGASAGIGRATAVLLTELGARVTLVGRHQARLNDTLGQLSGEGHRVAPFDFHDTDSIGDWFAGLAGEQGPFDGLVHSAGIGSLLPLRALTTSHVDEIMRINVYAAMALTKAFSRKRAYQSPGKHRVSRLRGRTRRRTRANGLQRE